MNEHTPPPRTSTATLASEAFDQARMLLRREVDLARAEADLAARKAGMAVGLAAGALVVALVALHVLAAALVAALTELGIEPGWSALIVGVVLAVIAGIMAAKAMSDLKQVRLAPRQVADSVREDARQVREAVRGHH